MEFIWDEAKRKKNIAKHGLDFIDAKKVFNGYTITYEDDRYPYNEQRFNTIGFLQDLIVNISHTETPETIRIFSMRKATNYEIKKLMQY